MLKKSRFIVIVLLVLVYATGCQQTSHEPNEHKETPSQVDVQPNKTSSTPTEREDANAKDDFPVKESEATDSTHNDEDHNEQSANDSAPDETDDSPIAQPDNTNHSTHSPSSDITDTRKNDQNEQRPDTNNLHIMNLYANQPLATVKSVLGEPLSKYTMQSQSGQWNVHEYQGFIVGFNQENTIQFMEVYDEQVDPMLEDGIGIGSSTNDVIEALGEPHTQSSYVLNYHSQQATLKFDLDPIDEVVLSIKLFSEN